MPTYKTLCKYYKGTNWKTVILKNIFISGFTVIEVLVVLSILAIFFVLCYYSTYSSFCLEPRPVFLVSGDSTEDRALRIAAHYVERSFDSYRINKKSRSFFSKNMDWSKFENPKRIGNSSVRVIILDDLSGEQTGDYFDVFLSKIPEVKVHWQILLALDDNNLDDNNFEQRRNLYRFRHEFSVTTSKKQPIYAVNRRKI